MFDSAVNNDDDDDDDDADADWIRVCTSSVIAMRQDIATLRSTGTLRARQPRSQLQHWAISSWLACIVSLPVLVWTTLQLIFSTACGRLYFKPAVIVIYHQFFTRDTAGGCSPISGGNETVQR